MSSDSRIRMICFRLSAEEYDKLHDFCFTTGTRGISELARAAINLLLQQQQQPTRASQETLEARVSDLEGGLHLLSGEMKSLYQHRAVLLGQK
jgi:SUMO ligase MMS21 Smc5/6 complex component